MNELELLKQMIAGRQAEITSAEVNVLRLDDAVRQNSERLSQQRGALQYMYQDLDAMKARLEKMAPASAAASK